MPDMLELFRKPTAGAVTVATTGAIAVAPAKNLLADIRELIHAARDNAAPAPTPRS